ncbi:protein BLISTER isoform X2 [Rutidosis leptorrhynchoides]|uniref:protein BLISTER isoform X2 n=1 Tax=Rutidosis leptorrhynchoides TaxID=125765 RepID=UPI003A990853
MASDQVLPNSTASSKKQQQLEAGKKRLEEFRKKKAAAKKASSSNPASSSNGDVKVTKSLVSDTIQTPDTTSDSGLDFQVGKNEKITMDVNEAETHLNPISSLNNSSASLGQAYLTDGKLGHDAPYAVDPEKSKSLNNSEEKVDSYSNHFSSTKLEDALKNINEGHLKDFTHANPVTTQVSVTSNLGQYDQPANGPTYRDSSSESRKSIQDILANRYPPISSMDNRNHKNLFDQPAIESSSSLWTPESISTSFRSEANQTSMSSGLAGRSRPSFLDSLNVSKNSSNSLSDAETDKANPFSSKVYPVDAPVSSYNNTQSFMSSSVANHSDPFRRNEIDIDRRNDFNSTKQNEDFAALEQHIEDLTQEKFSLQRALEASRVLAESLATENSALTDTYNQQGGVVNQLKADMERLQEEIKAQMVELEAMRIEYGNAQLECGAADERAKLLASEVIGLEEKALRLRSNELKLERQLENLEAEMSSQKRRISSLEKERQDLQSTIEALQEEKKLMQSKLWKVPATGNSVDIKKSFAAKKEASTSTDDLDENEDTLAGTTNVQATVGESDASGIILNRNLGFDVTSSSIPQDQMRMIHNINTLISELSLEKEELMQALSTESSLSSKLKELNKELSHKLEVQTQRLELLTSQSMVMSDNNNIPSRKSTPHPVVDNTPYADEGDEVVERVLGWIMKLFPGGPSKRQTKHL